MAGRIAPPRGSSILKKRTGENQTPRSAPQKSSGDSPPYGTLPLRNIRPLPRFGTLPVRISVRRLAQDAADACLERKFPRILRRKHKGNVPSLDTGFEGAKDQVFERDISHAGLEIRTPGIRVDVADADISSWGFDLDVATNVSDRHVPCFGADRHVARDTRDLDVSSLGFDLDRAACRYPERIVGTRILSSVRLDDDLRILAGDVHGNFGGPLLGGGGVGAHRVSHGLVIYGPGSLYALDTHLACGVGESYARFRTGCIRGIPGDAGARDALAEGPPEEDRGHREQRKEQPGEQQEQRRHAGRPPAVRPCWYLTGGRLCALVAPGLLFAPEAHPGSRPEPLLHHATVDVIEPDDVLLIELAEGDLQYPHLSFAGRGEPVHRSSGDEYLLPGLGFEYFFAELYLGSLVQNDPELVAAVVVLARERAARSDGDYLDRTR